MISYTCLVLSSVCWFITKKKRPEITIGFLKCPVKSFGIFCTFYNCFYSSVLLFLYFKVTYLSAEQGRAWHLTPPPYWKVTVVRTWHLALDTSASPLATARPSPSVPSQNRLLLRQRKSRSPTTALRQSPVCEREGCEDWIEKDKLKPLLRTVKAQDCESVPVNQWCRHWNTVELQRD